MKMGVVVGTKEPEAVWNAFRFGNTSLKANHETKIFLMNGGVEIEDIRDEKYNINEQVELFIKNKGKILACGTCMGSREKEGSRVCPISNMNELLELVEESDRILTFG